MIFKYMSSQVKVFERFTMVDKATRSAAYSMLGFLYEITYS